MYSQFRHQYPMGSLTSELLHIHEGKFIVRAIVQVGNATLSTGLSAAHSIEQAEDQARLRALVVLGIEEQSQEAQLIATDSLTTQFQAGPDFLALSESSLPSSLDLGWDRSQRATDSQTEKLRHYISEPAHSPESLEQLSWLEDVEPSAKKVENSPRRRSQSVSSPSPESRKPSANLSSSTPIDLSDIIAQTDIELKRLGWNHTQGRRYLEKTYQKKSRQHLTDAELLDFLDYLKSQSSSSQF